MYSGVRYGSSVIAISVDAYFLRYSSGVQSYLIRKDWRPASLRRGVFSLTPS